MRTNKDAILFRGSVLEASAIGAVTVFTGLLVSSNAPKFALFCLVVGLPATFWCRGVTIDLRRRVVFAWWGPLFPLIRRRRIPFEELATVSYCDDATERYNKRGTAFGGPTWTHHRTLKLQGRPKQWDPHDPDSRTEVVNLGEYASRSVKGKEDGMALAQQMGLQFRDDT